MATPNTPTTPDVIEAGRVLAGLDDLRAIMFMAAFLICFLFIFVFGFTIWREWLMNNERKQMRELVKSMGDNAGKVADSLTDLSTKIAVFSALAARTESLIAKVSEIGNGSK